MAGEPTLRWGSGGEAVVDLQTRLTSAGYSPGRIDGQFGPLTDAAVRQFQADNGLVADGIVGPRTWAALEHLAAYTAPPVDQSHVVFVEEPAVSGSMLTYKAARVDRAPIAAGAHVDSWNIEGDGNPMVASDTVTVPFFDAADGVYEVALPLPDLAPGTYIVHVGLTVTSFSSEVGHATFTV